MTAEGRKRMMTEEGWGKLEEQFAEECAGEEVTLEKDGERIRQLLLATRRTVLSLPTGGHHHQVTQRTIRNVKEIAEPARTIESMDRVVIYIADPATYPMEVIKVGTGRMTREEEEKRVEAILEHIRPAKSIVLVAPERLPERVERSRLPFGWVMVNPTLQMALSFNPMEGVQRAWIQGKGRSN